MSIILVREVNLGMEVYECPFCEEKQLVDCDDLISVKVNFKENSLMMTFECPICYHKVLIGRDLTKAEYLICKEFEDKKIEKRKKIKEGLRNSGKRLGRPNLKPEGYDEVIAKYNKGEITVKQACKELGISRTTFYNKRHKK